MTHSKNHTSPLDRSFHTQTVINGDSHRFLAQDMIALLCESQGNFGMYMILNSNDNSISQAFSNRRDRFSRSGKKISPAGEYEGLVDTMKIGKLALSLGPGFRYSHDFALLRMS
jgi:hypothetical protein